MSKKMTAVEWLVEQLTENGKYPFLLTEDVVAIEQAKAMEKQEKIKHQLFVGKVSCEIGFEKTVELLKEVNEEKYEQE